MSSKFNPARPAGKKPPICKGKRPPAPDATPGDVIPNLINQSITISIAWSEVSPIRPWSINRTFLVLPEANNIFRITDYQQDNVIMNLVFLWLDFVGQWSLFGTIVVDGINEDSIALNNQVYELAQPFFIPLRSVPTTHNPTPTPSHAFFGAALQ